ncbi:MAG: hypothetical protein ACMXYC_02265 [Candidatus Woesearchaeota archaeon]
MVRNNNGMITLQMLKDVLHTNSKVNELLLVYHGIKPSMRIIVDKEQPIQDICASLHIPCVTAPFKIQPTDSHQPYSHKAVLALEGLSLVYIGTTAQLACEAEQRMDHKALGDALGYPSCCSDFFVAHATQQQQHDNDFFEPLLKEHDNTKQTVYDWKINPFIRLADYTLISHIPCCLHCEASQKIAQSYLYTLQQLRPEWCVALEQISRWSVLFIPQQATYFLKHVQQAKAQHVMSTKQDADAEWLQHNALHIIDKHTIKTQDVKRGYLLHYDG